MLPIKFKNILRKIMRAIPNLKEDQLKELVKKRKEEAAGLLTDEGAAHIVAYELGVTLEQEKRFDTEIHVEDLSQGMNDVSISGRILLVGSTRSFTRKDGSEGKIAKLLVGDSTGVVDVTVWDDKTTIVTEGGIKAGEIVRISHGYVREGLNGQLELNIGKRGNIANIPDKSLKAYPRIKDYFRNIASIREDTKFLNLEGKVIQAYPSSEFKRADGTYGKVQRISLSDNTGSIICVFWDNKVELVKDIGIGNFIKIIGARVRIGREELEIHTAKSSEIEVIQKRETDQRKKDPLTISDIKAGMTNLDLLAWVLQIGYSRPFKTRDGNDGEVVTILLSDETGTIRINLWNDMARKASNIERGQYVSIKSAYAKSWFDTISLNLGSSGEIFPSKAPSLPEKMPEKNFELDKIAELEENQSFASIKGEIVQAPQLRNVMTNRQSEIKVVTFSVKDDSGEIDATFWGGLASIIGKMGVGTELIIHGAKVETIGKERRLKSNVLTTVDIL